MTNQREHSEGILHLARFDSHGTARARYGGRWIEVEQGIPGEVVRAKITGRKRPRAQILELLESAPDRVPAACRYFRDWKCGGCQWQHISYPGQIGRKLQSVEDALRIHGVRPHVNRVHKLPDPWRYRSTASISLGRRAGFRRHGSLAIVPIRDCPISHPLIGSLMGHLNDQLEGGNLPDYRGRVRLDVRLTEQSQVPRLQVLVRRTEARDAEGNAQEGREEIVSDTDTLRPLISVLQEMDEISGVSVLAADGAIETLKGELFAPASIGGSRVVLAASSFFQTNVGLLEVLIERLREECEPLAGKRIADVYGGVGVFGLFLAEEACEVIVVESDELATQAGRRTATEWNLTNVSFLNESAERGLAGIGPVDVVIVDPPRSGLSAAAIDALMKQEPQLILYVSCLAESLSRDLRQLSERGYAVQSVEIFDFYPQTYHVELLSVLRRP